MAEQIVHQAQLPDGRFVRMRELSSIDQETAAHTSNMRMPAKGEGMDVASMQRLNREYVRMALVSVSKPKPRPFDAAALTDADFQPLDYGKLETDYDRLFNAKCRVLLQRLYDRIHSPDEADLEAFLGEAPSVLVTG